MARQQVAEYELVDHGIDGAQYFQGCGVCYTKFDHVATGCGSNFAEAIDDVLDSIAQDGFDAENLQDRIMVDENIGGAGFPTEPNTDEFHKEDEDSEMYYYVSIRWK
jgi:hypothetical protein